METPLNHPALRILPSMETPLNHPALRILPPKNAKKARGVLHHGPCLKIRIKN
jgi:hypothetical protein